jgi:hypothetical protein
MSDDGGGDGVGDEAALDNPSDIWFGTAKHTVLRDCSLRGSTAQQKRLLLFGKDVQLLVRGSRFENVVIKADAEGAVEASRVGVVNSTLSPPLELPTVQPPLCGTNVAGESVCDARAQCVPGPTGGVQCACIGTHGNTNRLSTKAGARDDGSMCQQKLSVQSQLVASQLRLIVPKPGQLQDKIRLHVTAEGDRPVDGTFRVSMSVQQRSGGLAGSSQEVLDVGVNGSAFGAAISWFPQPSSAESFDLDSSKQNYIQRREYDFVLRVQCDAAVVACVQDGDMIAISIAFLPSEAAIDTAAVTIMAEVCDREPGPSACVAGVRRRLVAAQRNVLRDNATGAIEGVV